MSNHYSTSRAAWTKWRVCGHIFSSLPLNRGFCLAGSARLTFTTSDRAADALRRPQRRPAVIDTRRSQSACRYPRPPTRDNHQSRPISARWAGSPPRSRRTSVLSGFSLSVKTFNFSLTFCREEGGVHKEERPVVVVCGWPPMHCLLPLMTLRFVYNEVSRTFGGVATKPPGCQSPCTLR